MSKIYVLCVMDRFGEEVYRASDEAGKDDLLKIAEEYHLDGLESLSDPESSSLYSGLVIYECENDKEPYVAYTWGKE